jgi:hypothetical protein
MHSDGQPPDKLSETIDKLDEVRNVLLGLQRWLEKLERENAHKPESAKDSGQIKAALD